MAFAQHRRTPVEFTVPTRWAAAVAIVVGVLIGLGVWGAVLPRQDPLATGIALGLILGLPASVAVVFGRRTVQQGARRWQVAALGLPCMLVIAAMLFALMQRDASLAPIGAAAGVATGLVSLAIGLSRHRREVPQPREHARH